MNILDIILIAVILILVVILSQLKKTTNRKEKIPQNTASTEDYTNSYQPKWLFSYNEKDAYRKLKKITEPKNLTLLTKVRLFDLIEPKKDCTNIKVATWKIQAKHVDFVICNEKLVAKWIIELDDNSHIQDNRKKRDEFIDKAITNCGYKILHITGINNEEIENFLKQDKST